MGKFIIHPGHLGTRGQAYQLRKVNGGFALREKPLKRVGGLLVGSDNLD